LVGEVLYDTGSINKALERFESYYSVGSPRNLVNIAGCYIKQKRYKEAKPLLKTAAGINKSYTWYVGNFFEIVGERDSASILYGNLYGEDPLIYQYCDERLVNMSRLDYKIPEYLDYRNRRKRTYVRLFN
jgi:tetratricopeptide (TPR) repeat protein